MKLKRYQYGNIMNLFSRAAPKADPNPNPNAPKPDVDPNKNVDPNAIKDPNNPDPNKSKDNPLDTFKGMFDNTAKARDDAPPAFKLDPEKLKTVVGSLDFSSHVTPELTEKLKSGDPETTKTTLNQLGQNVYATILEHIPALTEAYVGARLDHDRKGLGQSVKSTMTKQSLDKLAADNPVLKRQLETIGEQLLQQFPDASPEWIAEQTPQYFLTVAKLLSPDSFVEVGEDGKPVPTKKDTDTKFDWGAWLQTQARQNT